MRAVPRWCVWQKQADGRKIPFRVLAGGNWCRFAKGEGANTPHLWVLFDEALHCFLKSNGHLGGLSFALGGGWCGVDFDDVIVGGRVHPQATSWLSQLCGYQEVSQSGKGIKTILLGVLCSDFKGSAETGRQFKHIPAKGMAVEVYDSRRFFFLTGKGSGEPIENQAGLDAVCADLKKLKELHTKTIGYETPQRTQRRTSQPSQAVSFSDVAVLDRIRSSRQASKFDALFAGHIGAYASSSEADMALTSILMFWCQNDKSQVERLFERSGLAKREKWDREDYRQRTLEKAHAAKVYQPRVAKNYLAAVSRVREALKNGK